MRKNSETFEKIDCRIIDSKNGETLYVPKGCANAWMTLEDNTIIHYYMSNKYVPEAGKGIRYNDKYFSIDWPMEPVIISDRDLSYEDYKTK